MIQEERLTLPGNEASGIVFHPARGTFFVVTDQGGVVELRGNGEEVQRVSFPGENFEGATMDPSTGYVYAVIEGRDRIMEIDPDGLIQLRTFSVNRKVDGEKILHGGKQGFEGITFRPDPAHPEGGVFFVANQSTGVSKKPEPSAVLRIELPLRSVPDIPDGKKQIRGEITGGFVPGMPDLSGLHYDAVSDTLLVLSDMADTLLRTSPSGILLQKMPVPGAEQEGVTVDGAGNIWLVEDRHDAIGLVRIGQPKSQ